MVCPTKSGEITDLLDHVLRTDFLPSLVHIKDPLFKFELNERTLLY